MNNRIVLAISILLLISCSEEEGMVAEENVKTEVDKITLALFAKNFFRPVDISNDKFSSNLYIVQQNGIIKIVDKHGVVFSNNFLDISGRVNDGHNEQGLLGLAFPPDFQSSKKFYVYYTAGTGEGSSRISRFSVSNNNLQIGLPDSEEILIEFEQPFLNHNAGDLSFGSDGYLYIATGDGGSGNDPNRNSQNKTNLLGKILRIDVSPTTGYVIPTDNPFVDSAGLAKEIWAYGLRNPWRFSFDRTTGDMWIGDVGQGNVEEVNYEVASSSGGLNYGWSCFEGFSKKNNDQCKENETYIDPVFKYNHNLINGGLSITGGYVYRGDKYASNASGRYICADYLSGHFWLVTASGGSFKNTIYRSVQTDITTFGENNAGELFTATLGGNIYSISFE